jgi:uncharacterized low-complexity protein
MKTALILTALLMTAAVLPAHAEETMGEKAAVTGNDVKRDAKKGMNHAKEAVCTEGDAKCAAKKMKHRAGEAKDATVDKAKEVKGDVD